MVRTRGGVKGTVKAGVGQGIAKSIKDSGGIAEASRVSVLIHQVRCRKSSDLNSNKEKNVFSDSRFTSCAADMHRMVYATGFTENADYQMGLTIRRNPLL